MTDTSRAPRDLAPHKKGLVVNPDWDGIMRAQAKAGKPPVPLVAQQATDLARKYAILRQALEEIYTDVDGSLLTCRNRAKRALEETD